MTREQALPYIHFVVDDAGDAARFDAIRSRVDASTRLVGWQCGFEPVFIAVNSYLCATEGPWDAVDDAEAETLATECMEEIGWFVDGPTPPDYIL